MNNRKINISEPERNEIRKMYANDPKQDYVFDFVLSEDNKYLIIMDQVFVEGNNGISIGSIWDNTYIFDNILKENFSKIGILKEDIEGIIENINWNKELINEWIKEKPVIIEGWFDDLKSGAGNLLKKIGQGGWNLAKGLWNQGVLPFLRWVRRGLYTGVGMVIDVVVSILALKTNAAIWGLLVGLDVYEIATNNFDPKDADRRQLPFFFLITDMIGAVFSGAAALTAKKAIPAIAREGLSKSPFMVKTLKTLLGKIPGLKNLVRSSIETLGTKMGGKSTGIISKILGLINSILDKAVQFITRLFSKEGIKAGAMGAGTLGIAKGVEKAIPYLDRGNKMGSGIASLETGIQKGLNYNKIKIPDATYNIVSDYLSKTNF